MLSMVPNDDDCHPFDERFDSTEKAKLHVLGEDHREDDDGYEWRYNYIRTINNDIPPNDD